MQVERTERGWAGHFIAAEHCKFRRNTLLQAGDVEIVVSTVGLMDDGSEIGYNRYYETMAFHSQKDIRYHDADCSKQISFDSDWAIAEIDADDLANVMHENVVRELTLRLEAGEKFEEREDE